ncbi:hypothetical protein C5D44_06290 [Rathayibacter sp. AY1B5]|nr:hypothetical protein C5D44_06290 [Rathayibacter sp. AY1B5]
MEADMLVTFLLNLVGVLPLEMALTFGLALFALSWLVPRRLVSLPQIRRRRSTLLWAATAGSVLMIVVASVTSGITASTWDSSGYDGWLRRPLPLLVATLVVAIAGFALRRTPLPAPNERAIAPRRSWRAFTPQPLLWIAGIVAAVIVVVALWQISIAVSAPRSGPFFGQVPDYTSLPIYMSFNGLGYVPGAGWPNHLATLLALVVAGVVLVVSLRAEANRPLAGRSTAPSVTADRESTARLLVLILLAGLITTLGAVLMHVGTSGMSAVGLDEQWVSEDTSITKLNITGGYSAIAGRMNLTGYVVQGAGVALALRIAVDALRGARRPAPAAASETMGATR